MTAVRPRQAATALRDSAARVQTSASLEGPSVTLRDGVMYFERDSEAPDPSAGFMSAPVALALADWLDHAAESVGLNRSPYVEEHLRHALAVAGEILGDE